MTKEAYFEMCEALGTAPVEEEIPIELEDFSPEAQELIEIYGMLRDDWDGMNGVYLGKSFVGISEIFDMMNIEKVDRKFYFSLLKSFDSIRQEEIQKLKPAE